MSLRPRRPGEGEALEAGDSGAGVLASVRDKTGDGGAWLVTWSSPLQRPLASLLVLSAFSSCESWAWVLDAERAWLIGWTFLLLKVLVNLLPWRSAALSGAAPLGL